MTSPIRPVSDDHRHEPADYELGPNELAACPFCGGAAERRDDPGVCDVPFGLVVEHAEGCFFLQPYASTDDEFVAAWNQRASLATRPANVDLDPDLTRALRSALRFAASRSAITSKQEQGILTALTQAPRSCCADERETQVCQVPPAGWYCTRDAGHDGPCAARPIDPLVNVIRHWLMSEDHPVSKWEIEFATAIRSNSHDG